MIFGLGMTAVLSGSREPTLSEEGLSVSQKAAAYTIL